MSAPLIRLSAVMSQFNNTQNENDSGTSWCDNVTHSATCAFIFSVFALPFWRRDPSLNEYHNSRCTALSGLLCSVANWSCRPQCKSHIYSEWKEHRTERNLYRFQFLLITGPKYIMLLIFLLAVIAKVAVVSADCNIGTVSFNGTDWTNVSYSVTPSNVVNMKMPK
jgi:hypothetical protein